MHMLRKGQGRQRRERSSEVRYGVMRHCRLAHSLTETNLSQSNLCKTTTFVA